MNKRQAVIVIHGIGNQYPMDTTRELAENLKDSEDIIYSGPDKEGDFFETRRLRNSKKNTDFYEFYWANLVQEPKSLDLYDWLVRLLFKKKPSQRVFKMVYFFRINVLMSIVALLFAFYKDINFSINNEIVYIGNIGLFSIVAYVFLKIIVPSVNIKAALTIGDAVKYLSPSPQNIESRYKIRQKGVKLLKKLHDKKNENGEQFYSRIIIVGHSLGSVIGYDLITHFWYDYIYNYNPKNKTILQPYLTKMSNLLSEKHKNKQDPNYIFPFEEYLNLQRNLFDEIKENGNDWLVSDFLTIGSPLCHGHYVLAKNKEEFERKTNYREFPLCPPKIDVKVVGNEIVKDYDNSISYQVSMNSSNLDGSNEKMRVINHSSQFSFIKWTNMYFKNDYVGGSLDEDFGDGIRNIPLKVKGNWFRKNLPFYSHTNYWDKEQEEALNEIKKIIF